MMMFRVVCLSVVFLLCIFHACATGTTDEVVEIVLGDDNNNNNNNKQKDWSVILGKIEKAQAEYKDCGKHCYKKQIRNDLHPWKQADPVQGNFDHAVFDNAATSGKFTHYQLVDGHLYRGGKCIFTMRCQGVEYFIQQIVDAKQAKGEIVADVEWLMNVHDYPQLSARQNIKQAAPVMSFSRTHAQRDIMYPAWAFWKGGPCLAKVEKKCLGRWDLKREYMLAEDNVISWADKQDTVFFRGSRTNGERDPLVRLGLSHPEKVDAKYVKNQSWRSDADSMGQTPVEEVSLEDHCQYKFLFNFRGVAASFRHRHLFLCNSLVFHVGNEWLEFYYNDMKPWVHYIPVATQGGNQGPSETDLLELIEFVGENDAIAQQIAQAGHDFVVEHLKMEDVTAYWARLLREYGKMQAWDITLLENEEGYKKIF